MQEVQPKALRSLNRRQWIHEEVIDTFVAMLEDLVEGPLQDILPSTQPQVVLYRTHCFDIRAGNLAKHFLDVRPLLRIGPPE